jgi:diadenosine tetraphosphatase ApaH/serine/threonine PP2A family protein phosphatase
MRYALLADVHGNLHALRAALGRLEGLSVDRFLHVGDLIGYGPLPNECVELLAGVGAVGVAGNHELIALGRIPDEGCTPRARQSLRWTREVLSEGTRRYLAALPERALVDGVMLAHGSLEDPTEYVTEPLQAERQLDRLQREEPEARILVLGHTHQPWAYATSRGVLARRAPASVRLGPGGRHLLNPGSVGQSRDRAADARFAVLDLGRGMAEFHAIPYDLGACREALRRRGLPLDSCHIKPPPFDRARWAVKRRLRRVLG